jgi:protein-S-isoprenylcysteine O-methyltransferase Ste14
VGRLVLSAGFFTVIAPLMAAGGIPALVLWLTDASIAPVPLLVVGAVLAALGIAVYLWTVFDFITRGRGTPNPYDAPRELVVSGLYRVVRNPMYVGVVSATAGVAAMFGSVVVLAYAAALLIAFHLRVIVYEEPTLARVFGASWESYRRRVPRWLPRVGGQDRRNTARTG